MDKPKLKPHQVELERKAKGWTQRDLARKAGVSEQTIMRIESRKTVNPEPATLEKIRLALQGEIVALALPMVKELGVEPLAPGFTNSILGGDTKSIKVREIIIPPDHIGIVTCSAMAADSKLDVFTVLHVGKVAFVQVRNNARNSFNFYNDYHIANLLLLAVG